MGPTWGPSGADRTQVGPMLAPWTSLSGIICHKRQHFSWCHTIVASRSLWCRLHTCGSPGLLWAYTIVDRDLSRICEPMVSFKPHLRELGLYLYWMTQIWEDTELKEVSAKTMLLLILSICRQNWCWYCIIACFVSQTHNSGADNMWESSLIYLCLGKNFSDRNKCTTMYKFMFAELQWAT